MKNKIILTIIFIIVGIVCFYYIHVKDYAILNGYYDKEDYWDSEGFQDYDDYCKYYYKDKDDKKFIKSSLYKKVNENDIENIVSYFNNFEKVLNDSGRLDIYDFDVNLISEGDYFRLEARINEKVNYKFSDYTLYLYDIESNILYYIHSG